MWKKLARFIKLEHTAFSLPMLFAGAALSQPWAGWGNLLWGRLGLIVLAGIGARAAALALNRLFDAKIDARNPRTQDRELASGALKTADGWVVFAAGVGLCALTAYSMIVTKGQLRPGQTVLITGIGGGVATAALAIAKHFACPVAVTSRHAWKLEKAKALGADLCVLDDAGDWSKAVRAWTAKRGVDMAVDSSGKATHLNCIKSLARGGAYVTPGCTSGPDTTTDLARIFWNQLRVLGSTMGSNDEFREVTALFRARKLLPVVDQVFTPERAVDAYKRLEGSEQFGKIVVRWA